MNDPKYTIRDGRLWHIGGNYAVPEEEPIMILRGKDPIALAMIRTYLESGVDAGHRESATERLMAFSEYQERYPARTRQGCHMHGDGE